MIPRPRLPWREILVVFTLPVIFAVYAAYPPPPLVSPFHRAPMLAAPTPPAEDNPCVEWGVAGAVPIYRCVDTEQYIVCYSQGGFMIFCLPQQ